MEQGIGMLAIGVGCFWFAIRKSVVESAGGNIYFREHLRHVRLALEGIDSISELEINVDPDMAFLNPNMEASSGDEDSGQLFINGSIEFDLYLPFRVQENYGFHRSLEVEKFHVSMTYSFDFPVCFIYYSLPDNVEPTKSSPNTSVVITRRFLEENCEITLILGSCFLVPAHFMRTFL
jgi:hypothetical protein